MAGTRKVSLISKRRKSSAKKVKRMTEIKVAPKPSDQKLREKLMTELGMGVARYDDGSDTRIISADAPAPFRARLDEIGDAAGLSRSAVIKALLFWALREYPLAKN